MAATSRTLNDPVERRLISPGPHPPHEHGEANAFDAQRTVDQAFCVAFLGVESFEFLQAQAHNGALVFREDLELLAQRIGCQADLVEAAGVVIKLCTLLWSMPVPNICAAMAWV